MLTSDFVIQSIALVVQRIIIPILVFIGIIGNSFSINIFTKKHMRSSSNAYLTALSVAFCIYLIFAVLLSFEIYPSIHKAKYELFWRFYGIINWFTSAARSASVWFVLCFTLEKFLKIHYDKQSKLLQKESIAKCLIAIISILSISLQSSTAFEYQLNSDEQCLQYCIKIYKPDSKRILDKHNCSIIFEKNISNFVVETISDHEIKLCLKKASNCSVNQLIRDTYCCKKTYFIRTEFTNFGNNWYYNTIYYWFKGIIFIILPLLCITIFNFFILKALKNKSAPSDKYTTTLVKVSLFFLLTDLPFGIFWLYSCIFHRQLKLTFLFKGLRNLFTFLKIINASLTTFIYLISLKNYRQTLIDIFLKNSNTASTTSLLTDIILKQSMKRNYCPHHGNTISNESQSLNNTPKERTFRTKR